MLKRGLKAHWKIHGLKYRMKGDVLHGKIYTAYPMKFFTAGAKALRMNVVFVLTLMFVLVVQEDYGILWPKDELLLSIIMTVFLLSYPALLFLDGENITMTANQFTVGRKKYKLRDMSSFKTEEVSYEKPGQHFIRFQYGLRAQRIPVINSFNNQLDIINSLNRMVERLQKGELASRPKASEIEVRSAGF